MQRHFTKEISVGDEVFIWRSDGGVPFSGGIVAKGKIISLPEIIIGLTPDLWREKPQNYEAIPKVRIELESVRLSEKEGMIKRTELMNDKHIKNLQILSMWRRANYKVEPSHARHINELWERKGKKRIK